MTTNSSTQAANIAKLVGLVLILFGIKVEEGALAGFAEVVGALITAGAILAHPGSTDIERGTFLSAVSGLNNGRSNERSRHVRLFRYPTHEPAAEAPLHSRLLPEAMGRTAWKGR